MKKCNFSKTLFLPQNAKLIENENFSLFIRFLKLWQTIPSNDVCTNNYRQPDTAKYTGRPFQGGICALKFPTDSAIPSMGTSRKMRAALSKIKHLQLFLFC